MNAASLHHLKSPGSSLFPQAAVYLPLSWNLWMCIGPVVDEGQGRLRPPPDVRLCAVSPVRCWLRQSAEPREVQQEDAGSVTLAAQVNLRGLGTRQIPAPSNESWLCLWPVRRGFWSPKAVFFLLFFSFLCLVCFTWAASDAELDGRERQGWVRCQSGAPLSRELQTGSGLLRSHTTCVIYQSAFLEVARGFSPQGKRKQKTSRIYFILFFSFLCLRGAGGGVSLLAMEWGCKRFPHAFGRGRLQTEKRKLQGRCG